MKGKIAPVAVAFFLLLIALPSGLAAGGPNSQVNLTVNVSADEVNAHIGINASEATVYVDGVDIGRAISRANAAAIRLGRELDSLERDLRYLESVLMAQDAELAKRVGYLAGQVEELRILLSQDRISIGELYNRTNILAEAIVGIMNDVGAALDEHEGEINELMASSTAVRAAVADLSSRADNLTLAVADLESAVEELTAARGVMERGIDRNVDMIEFLLRRWEDLRRYNSILTVWLLAVNVGLVAHVLKLKKELAGIRAAWTKWTREMAEGS